MNQERIIPIHKVGDRLATFCRQLENIPIALVDLHLRYLPGTRLIQELIAARMGIPSSVIRNETLVRLFGDTAKTYIASFGVNPEQEMPPVHSHQEALSSARQLTALPYDTATIEATGSILANPALPSPPEQDVLAETGNNPLTANVSARLKELNTMLCEFLSLPVRLQEGSDVWS